MKKVNFMTFFTGTKASFFKRAIIAATTIIIPLYVLIIIAMHSMQGYTWYQLSYQKNMYKDQSSSFENITKDHHTIQNEKLTVQQKITFLNQQKNEAINAYERLKSIYYNPQEIVTALTIKNDQFSCSCSQKTAQKAHEFLRGLKTQPLVRKARITHLTRRSGHYCVDVKGSFKKAF